MNEPERTELERLKERHARLEKELSLLATQLRVLENRLAEKEKTLWSERTPTSIEPKPEVKRPSPKPPPLPPIISPQPKVPEPTVSANVLEPVKPPAEPIPVVPPRPAETPPPIAPIPPIQTPPKPEPAVAQKASFEMRLGTYWLVRIGAVLVLTGLVFFGNLAYQRMGEWGKVTLLYLASGLLLGAGWWCQRQSVKESLKNYGQVLFAGGLAAVYFTTYAAHHVTALRVIDSALLDGFLLLAWAAFMAWIADRKKSELLALFAVALAYYSSVITPVGSFTLYSNGVLAATAVFFLLRNRWVGLSWASLLATYVAYGYWRFYHTGEGWRFATPEEGLWFGASFLFSYWAIFTLAAFLSKHESMAGERRAGYVTFNNGALFTLFLLTMIKVHHGKFWQFSLGYGVALLVLAELARRFLSSDAITKNTYLTQGLVLATVGIISHPRLAGLQLALILAAESVLLFILGTFRKNIFLQTGAYITGALAVGWGIDGLERDNPRGLWLGASLGALMLLNAWWSHWRTAFGDRREFRPVPAYFTLLALVMWGFTTWFYTSHANFGLVLALETLALTFSVYLLRVPEIPLLGAGYILFSQISCAFEPAEVTARQIALALVANSAAYLGVGLHRKNQFLSAAAYVSAALALLWGIGGLEKFGNAGLIVGTFLGVIFAALAWWMHQISVETEKGLLRPVPTYFTLLALVMWIATTWHNANRDTFPLALAIEAVVLTASVYVLRVREFPLLGQGLLVLGQLAWVNHFGQWQGPWWNPLSMIAVTLGLSHWWQRQKVVSASEILSNVYQAIYALGIVGLIYSWLQPHNSTTAWIALTSLLAVGVTAYGVATRAWPLAICGQIFLLISWFTLFSTMTSQRPEWQYPLAPMAALGLFSFATWLWFARKPESDPKVRKPLLQLAMIYRWVALVMSLWWVHEYINARERVWVYALVGLLVFLFAGWRRNREALVFGAVFTLVGFIALWLKPTREQLVYFPNFLVALTLLGQQQFLRRLTARYEIPKGVNSGIILVGGLTLWRLISEWLMLDGQNRFLTATWAGLAFGLFACGVGLRERMYRWVGLGILAVALGRVVFFDVWKMEMVFRVLSFMALGVVLIVLGFIYIKYEERIRKWL